MTLKELVDHIKEANHYITNIRCDEGSQIFLSLKGEDWWYAPYPHDCLDLDGDLQITDERFLGGTCGNLITVGKEVNQDEEVNEGDSVEELGESSQTLPG